MSDPKPITDQQLRRMRPLMKAFTKLNAWVFKASNGRLMSKFSGCAICLVTMTGAKSGRRIDIPLMYVPFGEGVILVASLGGAPRHPTWFYNLVANPEIEVREGGRLMKLRARRVDADEKAKLWPICCEHYPPYESYQRRTERDIPVFDCQPG
jgi:deazaflavin-dependent oxidoreductase (nitroreductase family)